MLHFYCLFWFNSSYCAFVQWNCWAFTFTNTPSLNELAYYAVLSRRNASWTKAQTSDWNALSSKTDASIHQSHHHQHKGPPWAHWRVRLNLTNTQVLIVHARWTIAQTRAQVLNVHARWTNAHTRAQVLLVHARWTKPTSGTSGNYSSLTKQSSTADFTNALFFFLCFWYVSI